MNTHILFRDVVGMPNDTSCSPTSNCTILEGASTNGTYYVAQYDPNFPVPYWHKNMELATIIVCNSLTLLVIAARLGYRWKKSRRFKGDDRWMMVAGVFLVALFVSQLGSNKYGSGLHVKNVPKSWRPWHWRYSLGFGAYYIVVSCIKLSVCWCFLQILTYNLKGLRYCVFGLCAIIASLGVTCTIVWVMGCQPFLSNFLWSVPMDVCVNYDIFRWLWIAISVPVDLVIMSVPLRILNLVRLRNHEKRILQLVFCATFAGTICCIIGIYGSFKTRTIESNDLFYNETAFVMMNDIEIFAYTLGSSFPVLSRYIVHKTSPGSQPTHNNFSSWARYIPDFFRPEPSHHTLRSRTRGTTIDVRNSSPELHTPIKRAEGEVSCHASESERDLTGQGEVPSLYKPTSSQTGSSEGEGTVDLEKRGAQREDERVVRVTTEVVVERSESIGERGQSFQDFLKGERRSDEGKGHGW